MRAPELTTALCGHCIRTRVYVTPYPAGVYDVAGVDTMFPGGRVIALDLPASPLRSLRRHLARGRDEVTVRQLAGPSVRDVVTGRPIDENPHSFPQPSGSKRRSISVASSAAAALPPAS